MRRFVVAATIVAFVSGVAFAVSQDEFYMLAGFDMAVARTSKGVSLTCNAGCAWKTLEFSLGSKPTPVNEKGLAGDKTSNPEKDGNFLIRFDTKDDGFTLSCDRGCAWRTLGWNFPKSGTATRINEYGMVAHRR